MQVAINKCASSTLLARTGKEGAMLMAARTVFFRAKSGFGCPPESPTPRSSPERERCHQMPSHHVAPIIPHRGVLNLHLTTPHPAADLVCTPVSPATWPALSNGPATFAARTKEKKLQPLQLQLAADGPASQCVRVCVCNRFSDCLLCCFTAL